MRLYLSSFRFGDHGKEFARLVGPNRRVALIAHADDPKEPSARAEGVARELAGLTTLGLEPFELDLRPHFHGGSLVVREMLETCGAVWVRGGNTFVLRRALRLSGADATLVDLVGRDALAWGGYSAGACVIAPDLHGLEVADDPAVVPPGYETLPEPVWEGLGLVSDWLVPHVSRTGPSEPWIAAIVAAFVASARPYRTLADGEAIVREGENERWLR